MCTPCVEEHTSIETNGMHRKFVFLFGSILGTPESVVTGLCIWFHIDM